MANSRLSPAKKSKGKTALTPQSGNNRRSSQGTPARAHRDDTPEARGQRAGVAKTHPFGGGRPEGGRRGSGRGRDDRRVTTAAAA